MFEKVKDKKAIVEEAMRLLREGTVKDVRTDYFHYRKKDATTGTTVILEIEL